MNLAPSLFINLTNWIPADEQKKGILGWRQIMCGDNW